MAKKNKKPPTLIAPSRFAEWGFKRYMSDSWFRKVPTVRKPTGEMCVPPDCYVDLLPPLRDSRVQWELRYSDGVTGKWHSKYYNSIEEAEVGYVGFLLTGSLD